MFFVAWVVIGLLAGLAVNRATDRQNSTLIGDMVLGIFGSVVGGFVFNVLLARNVVEFNLLGLPCAALGALLMLGGFHALRRVGHGFL
jgi:uncharacterized membrane protein YeaQ/YmgE (transglycosylase-associated protein family)